MALPIFGYAENFYCGESAAGLEDGSSWANQWACSACLAEDATAYWHDSDLAGEIDAGDTLYVDGGASGITYPFTFFTSADGESGNVITIRPGQDASHNGVVTITSASNGIAFENNYITHLKRGQNQKRRKLLRTLLPKKNLLKRKLQRNLQKKQKKKQKKQQKNLLKNLSMKIIERKNLLRKFKD